MFDNEKWIKIHMYIAEDRRNVAFNSVFNLHLL